MKRPVIFAYPKPGSDLKKKIERLAEKENRTESQQVIWILEKFFDECDISNGTVKTGNKRVTEREFAG